MTSGVIPAELAQKAVLQQPKLGCWNACRIRPADWSVRISSVREFFKLPSVIRPLALHGYGHAPVVARSAVFPEIDALPGSEGAASFHDRDRQAVLGQDSANVGRHIIRPFVVVFEPWRTIRYQTCHEGLQVMANRRIGVLAKDERGAGMMHEYMHQTCGYTRFPHDAAYAVGDRVGSASSGSHGKRVLCHHAKSSG